MTLHVWMHTVLKTATIAFVGTLLLNSAARGQSQEELVQQLRQALTTIDELQRRVSVLEKQAASDKPAVPASTGGAVVATPAVPGASESPPAPVLAPATSAEAGSLNAGRARLEISGKIHMDLIYDFKRVDPNWNSTLRPSTIPINCPGDPGCGKNGETIFSVRQSSIAFKGFVPTAMGELKSELSFDLFASEGGNTQFRLYNAWAELNRFGVGQYYSLFMNVDTFPNVVDYWGPSGMVYVRNPQLRYTPYQHNGAKFELSLEAPNAAIDTGKLSDADPTLGVRGRTKWPDLIGKFSLDQDWGQFYAAAILRSLGYETTTSASGNPAGEKTGWGINLNGFVKTWNKDRVIAQLAYGHGIASYMNDGGVDLAPGDRLQAETVSSLGWFVYYDRYWTETWSSSVGYSVHRQGNTGGQLGNAFKQGRYASANLLWSPAKNVLTGAEFLWGRLEQKSGASGDDARLQFSGQYKF